ncbi:MAG: DNA-processing protein DprA [Candidatus Brocadiia bacterium]
MGDDVVRDLVALNMTLRFGVADYERLVAALGSHEAVRGASARDLRSHGGLGPKLAAEVARLQRSDEPDEELAQAAERGVAVVPFTHPDYPKALRRIHDPPLVLYVEGGLEPADAVALAVVGTRRATHYGRTQAARLAAELATRGVTIVSGFARGIDTEAHRAALDAGGRTLAVLGSGLAALYPPENAPLAEEVVKDGALVSEFPLHTRPLRPLFPRRNRIVSGLALGVVVVEAGWQSGALITADWALDQGREVFALPGRVDRAASRGCHRLVRDGATLVETADHVLEGLGDVGATLAPPRAKAHAPPLELAGEEATVAAAVGDEPTHIDVITDACGLPAHTVASVLMVLEVKKAVSQLPGKLFVRTAPR